MTATTMTQDTTYNGWTNWETWCASLWINNEEALYRTARIYGHSGYERLLPYLQAYSETTGDGLAWDDPNVDRDETHRNHHGSQHPKQRQSFRPNDE